jgi:hypothetical protein
VQGAAEYGLPDMNRHNRTVCILVHESSKEFAPPSLWGLHMLLFYRMVGGVSIAGIKSPIP